jgi:hypothetical protein
VAHVSPELGVSVQLKGFPEKIICGLMRRLVCFIRDEGGYVKSGTLLTWIEIQVGSLYGRTMFFRANRFGC